MRKLLTTLSIAALMAGCTGGDTAPKQDTEAETTVLAGGYDIEAQYEKFAPVTMTPDTSFLTASEKAVVNKLIEISPLMNAIYMRQLNTENPALRNEIEQSSQPNKEQILKMFDQHYGVCDGLADGHIFFGDTPCPKGGGFYPADMTQQEFEEWVAAHPDDEAAFRSGYTVIKRDGEKLIAVPYSEEYKEWLVPAAALMREAAELSEEPTLKRFLNLRADSFMSDDYFESEMAWMDLEGNIEIAIGPYEVYDDGLFGYKTAFESFVTIKNPEESAALAKYKNWLRDMEANLPVEEKYKNFKRGFESPIAVTYQVQGGGDNVPGVQTIAFNLPNDERVREAKGAKKVILNNVLGAKYDRILGPIAQRALVKDQANITAKKYMSYETLFHELSHSLGPGTIMVGGDETTVSAQLKELYSGIEEGKADVMGAYNVLYMMERGELPIAEKNSFLATYFAGMFRAMRFGTDAAHGKGAAFQYNYFREVGAVTWQTETERFEIDYPKLDQAISDLTAITVRVQGDGDYAKAKAFLDAYLQLDAEAVTILSDLDHIPVDIRPIYPDKI
jgi:hypothetical protein